MTRANGTGGDGDEQGTERDDEQMRIDDFGGRRLLTDGGVDLPDHEEEKEPVDLAVDYERLWYIKLRGEDDKRPAESWGGYDQDFEDAECVYTHDEVVKSPHEWWGVVGYREEDPRMSRELLIFDLDTHKADDPEAAVKNLTVNEGTLIVRSQSGGHHVWHTVTAQKGAFKESDFEIHEDLEFDIDVRGSAVSHHVVAPADIAGVGGSYEVVNNESIRNKLAVEDVCCRVQLAGEPAVEYNPTRGFGNGDGESGYEPDGDEWLLEDDVKEALEHVPASLKYSADDEYGGLGWRDVGFAIADYYARTGAESEDAVDTIVEWSKTAPDAFDEDTERHAFNIVKSGFESVEAEDDDDRVTVGTLLSVAEANGWEWPNVEERKALRDVRAFIDEWGLAEDRGEDDDSPGKDEMQTLARAVARLTEEDYKEYADEVSARVSAGTDTMDRHRELWDIRADKGSVVNHAGKLSKIHGIVWLTTTPIFNFEFDVDSILELPGEDEGRSSTVKVAPSEPNEPEFEIKVEPRVFNDARRFKDTVLSQMYSTVIESDRSDADVMDMVRQYIAARDVPVREGQYEMGLSDDGEEFVVPSGSIGPDGGEDNPGHTYVDQGSQTNATIRSFSAEPDENDEVDDDDVARMLELASQSRLPERITPILSWFAAAPFRPLIFEQTATFNPLGVFGRSGSGKTATLAAFNQMWGMSNEPLAVNASKFATLTGFTSSRGVPVWFDEYRPEATPDYIMDRWHTWFKKAATGGVEPRGNQSMGTDDWHLRSPIVVSGESEITNDAERRRSVMVNVTTKPTQDGHPARDAFKDLVGDVTTDDAGNVVFPEAEFELQDFAVAYYAWVADMSDDEFRAAWYDAREKVAEFAAEHDLDLGDTELQGLQTVVFGHRRVVSFAQTVGADLSKLPSADDLDAALKLVADVDGDGRQPHEHQFLSLVSRAAAAGYLEDATDYRVVHEGKANEELRVNVTRAFDKVSKFTRDHDLNEDLLQSASDYKTRFEQLEDEGTFVTVTKQPTQGISRCTGIDMDRGVEEIAGFARESFVDVDDEDDDGEIVNSDSDGGGGGATPIGSLDEDEGYVTVTAEVVDWSATPDEVAQAGGPIESGSLTDVTGRVDVVVFAYGLGDEPDGISHLCEEETVRVKNAEVTGYDGSPQIILDKGTTITPVQRGVGYIPPAEAEDGQAVIESASETGQESQDAARTDGGEYTGLMTESQRERVGAVKNAVSTVEEKYDAGAPVEEVRDRAKEEGVDMDKFDHAMEKLRRKGDVYEPQDGRLRATGGD
ncbi:hypothetical protein [Natronorubrum sulfidifaciens]|nr:hypothetical protein [Natronorubrum sulfidifaciens]